MRNVIIDLKTNNKEELNDDLGELLLPGTSLNFPKKLSEKVEVLRSSSQLLDFIPIHSDDTIWKIEIIYRSKDSPQARHAKLSCVSENEYALQLSGRISFYSKLEDALVNLLKGGLLVENGNINHPPNPPRN